MCFPEERVASLGGFLMSLIRFVSLYRAPPSESFRVIGGAFGGESLELAESVRKATMLCIVELKRLSLTNISLTMIHEEN